MSSEGRRGFVFWFLGFVTAAWVLVAAEEFSRGQTRPGIGWLGVALVTGLIGYTWGWIAEKSRRIWQARIPFNPRGLVMDLAAINLHDLNAGEPTIGFELDVENTSAATVDITDVNGSAAFSSPKSSVTCTLKAELERPAGPLRLQSAYRQRLTIRQPLQTPMAAELYEVLTGHENPIVNVSLRLIELVGTVNGSGPLPPCPVMKDFQIIGPLAVRYGKVAVRKREEAYVDASLA